TLLDFFSFGSASASQFQTLRPFFFWATLLILAESIRRNGLDRRAFFRITISGFFLALPQVSQGGYFHWTKSLYHLQPGYTRLGKLRITEARLPYPNRCYHNLKPNSPTNSPTSPFGLQFWSSRVIWRRALLNTLRCLIGCSIGDFSSMWFLQAQYPDLAVEAIMGVSMATGIASSISLETVLLKLGRDKLGWAQAFTTAAGMSMISMLSMEAVQNMVDYQLTGGVVTLSDPFFWTSAVLSMAAGFLAPLPYNYIRLRNYGKACH
ncbi:hypothetical protein ACO22_04259, partial [Paracoccidioides brasiliensis]